MAEIGFSKTDLQPSLLPKDWPVREERVEAISFYARSEQLQTVWVVLDFMDFDRYVTDMLKKAIHEKSEIGQEHIHIVTTHNHGGGEPDIGVLSGLVAEGVKKAVEGAKPAHMRYVFSNSDKQVNYIRRIYVPEIDRMATLFYGTSQKTGFDSAPFVERMIGLLREGKQCYSGGVETERTFLPFEPGDEEVVAVQFRTPEGEPIGSVVRFAAHAVCCNRDGSFSSDYPFYVRRKMEESFGGVAMFLNGPCGDIAPGMIDKFDGTERVLGEYIAELAVSALDKLPFEEIGILKDSKYEVKLPVRHEVLEEKVEVCDEMPDDLHERYKYLDNKSLGGLMGFLRSKYLHGEDTPGDEISVFLGFLQLGDLVFAGFPGETFSVTGKALQQAFPGCDICTVTEHERTVMYLPPREDSEMGSYESVCRTTDFQAEDVLRQGAISALDDFME